MSADLYIVATALRMLPTVCRYHADDFGRLGYEGPADGGMPRCESCRAPWRRMMGLAALDRVQARFDRQEV